MPYYLVRCRDVGPTLAATPSGSGGVGGPSDTGGVDYAEHPARVPGLIAWHSTAGGGAGRVLPDGCMDLIWFDDRLMVAGPDTVAQLVTTAPGTRFTGLRFGPGLLPRVLGVPADELTDRRVPAEALLGDTVVGELADRASESSQVAALEEFGRDRLVRTDRRPWLAPTVHRLRAGASASAAADALGWSERTFRRACLEAFGYGAKRLALVLRLQRALDMARAGRPFAVVAADAGYADQAHLSRDVRLLTSTTLRELVG